MAYLRYPVNLYEEVDVDYMNQHWRDNMNVLYDLFSGAYLSDVSSRDDQSVLGGSSEWQVLLTLSPRLAGADMYFKWTADMAPSGGAVDVDVGWRQFGAQTVNLLASGATAARGFKLRRILHSSLGNAGLIEIVARNTATETRVASPQWSTDWNVRYRWEWTERQSVERVISVPYTSREQTGTRVERQAYTEEVCEDVPTYSWTVVLRFEGGGLAGARRHFNTEAAANASLAFWRRHINRWVTWTSGRTRYTVFLTQAFISRQVLSTRRVCRDVTRYREITVPVFGDVTRYRDETRTVGVDVERMSDWTVARSGTESASTETASLAAARSAANAVEVPSSGRPNAEARAVIERNVESARDTSSIATRPGGTAVFSNMQVESQILLGEATRQT